MLTSAADLWKLWCQKNLIRPQDYDEDVVEAVRSGLGVQGQSAAGLPAAMDAAGWKATDLLRAVLPIVTSFSGMLSDLLSMYERIGASNAGGDNLRIMYEFKEGEPIDETLAHFREVVQRTQTVIEHLEVFHFAQDHAWDGPLKAHGQYLQTGFDVLDLTSNEEARSWPFRSEIPTRDVSDPRLSVVIARHRQVILAALKRLESFGDSMNSAHNSFYTQGSKAWPEADQALYFAGTDFWPISQIGAMHALASLVDNLPPDKAETLIRAQSEWLEGFWTQSQVAVDQQIDELTDILSLPQWGQRFDLYSAWLATVMDRALDQRMVFDVPEGVLAFPFRPTLLARLQTQGGPVELWAEKRFSATNLVGHGRTANIQPDYVFVSSTTSTVIGAVEAKQYKSQTSKNPARAAHDYAGNLKSSKVFIVAHGPLRGDSIETVDPADRSRVFFHAHVRPGNDIEIGSFCEELSKLLPPVTEASSARAPARNVAALASSTARVSAPVRAAMASIMLEWSPSVEDLDLHLLDVARDRDVSYRRLQDDHATLGADAYGGGPEVAFAYPTGGPVDIEVHLHSSDADSVADAKPIVTVTTLGGTMRLVPDATEISGPVWRVGVIDEAGKFTPDTFSELA